MPPTSTELDIVHNLAAQRIETTVEGRLCRAEYRRVGDTLHLVHTEVPPPHEGKGIAGVLVQAALDYAADNRLKVVPLCGYVRAYMRRHPETHALLSSGARV
jgi:predicted GNAT family acetyltransferase